VIFVADGEAYVDATCQEEANVLAEKLTPEDFAGVMRSQAEEVKVRLVEPTGLESV